MAAMAVLPESPVWLKWKGRGAEAGKAARRLLGAQGAADLVEGTGQESGEESLQGWGGEEEQSLVPPVTGEVGFRTMRHEHNESNDTYYQGWGDQAPLPVCIVQLL